MNHRYLLLLPVILLAGCAVGPNYKRPAVPAPPEFRGGDPGATATSVTDTKWFDLFQDDNLKQLVNTALEHNFDLAIATERVAQARAQYGITRADLFPFLDGQAGFTAQRQSSVGSIRFVTPGTNLAASFTQVGGSLSWELDLWGRLRRLNEAARAEYLGTEEGRRAVIVSLIGAVMDQYFALRELDLELQIAERTRGIAQDSLRLVSLRHDRGAATGLDVHQAEQFLYTATAQIASAQRDSEQTGNALNLILGQLPSDVARGKSLEQFTTPVVVPAGIPSSLLERRPDIRQAEQSLIAANARIGAARALYFPQISLTGFFGGQSRQLSNIFKGNARSQSISPGLLVPIFNAGQIRNQVRLSEAQQRELLINYQKTIYTAFREVSDALVGYKRTGEQLTEQDRLVKALEESVRLSRLRYEGGLDSYLQVLDSQRNLFQGQLRLAQLRLQVLSSFVQVYRSLGGGWQ